MSEHLEKLLEIMMQLLEPEDGCPWASVQTHASLTSHVIEEAYEAAEAMEGGDDDALRDELGDLLLQVVFHARIAERRGAFTFNDVAETITNKLIRRYPTILGDEPNTLRTAEEIIARWNEVKEQERQDKAPERESVLDGVPTALPGLLRAAKLKRCTAANGWDWKTPEQLLEKIDEEVGEVKAEVAKGDKAREEIGAEIGDALFLLADLARWYDLDPEDCIRQCCDRFETRTRHMEAGLKAKGLNFVTSEWEDRQALWKEAKALEKQKKAG